MRWILRGTLAGLMAVAGCAPPAQSPDQPQQGAPAATGLQAYAGRSYEVFVSNPAYERYAIAAFGASQSSRERFEHSMANRAVGVLVAGGGSEALVFSGCAPTGCLEGLSVIAIDTQTGEVFAGVSDMAGQERLMENDRLEALLRLTSPSQTWDDPVRPAPATQ